MTTPTAPHPDYIYLSSKACKGCGELIHWYETPAGKHFPADADGTSHFATCLVASRFRRTTPPSEMRRG